MRDTNINYSKTRQYYVILFILLANSYIFVTSFTTLN